MGFKKGNQLGKKNKGTLGIKKRAANHVAEQLISLTPTYNECLKMQMDGTELPDATKEGMDRFEKMYEYAQPKLARQEVSGINGGAIEQKLIFSDEQAGNITTAARKLSERSGEK